MTSIAELTPEVISLLNENEAAVLAYVSRRHYETVAPTAAAAHPVSPDAPAATQPTLTAIRRTEAVKGSYRLGSTVDEEATFRQHRDNYDLGYNVNVAATPHFIREINAVTRATPDGKGVANLVSHQKANLGVVPPKLVYDRAAGMPKIFADVAKASDDQTQLVARLINHSQNKERFGLHDFILDEQGHLHCPNGQATNRTYRSGSADDWNYRFKAEQCQGCPFAAQCRDPTAKPNSHRTVFVSDYFYQQRQAIAYTKTDAFKADMKLRPHIAPGSPISACLTRYNGARHATAFNLKRWAVLTQTKGSTILDTTKLFQSRDWVDRCADQFRSSLA